MMGGLGGQALVWEAVSVSDAWYSGNGPIASRGWRDNSFWCPMCRIRSARHSTGDVSATVNCGCMYANEQICRVFWILSIVLSPTMWGRKIAG